MHVLKLCLRTLSHLINDLPRFTFNLHLCICQTFLSKTASKLYFFLKSKTASKLYILSVCDYACPLGIEPIAIDVMYYTSWATGTWVYLKIQYRYRDSFVLNIYYDYFIRNNVVWQYVKVLVRWLSFAFCLKIFTIYLLIMVNLWWQKG